MVIIGFLSTINNSMIKEFQPCTNQFGSWNTSRGRYHTSGCDFLGQIWDKPSSLYPFNFLHIDTYAWFYPLASYPTCIEHVDTSVFIHNTLWCIFRRIEHYRLLHGLYHGLGLALGLWWLLIFSHMVDLKHIEHAKAPFFGEMDSYGGFLVNACVWRDKNIIFLCFKYLSF